MAAMIVVFPAALLFICALGFSSRPHEAQPAVAWDGHCYELSYCEG